MRDNHGAVERRLAKPAADVAKLFALTQPGAQSERLLLLALPVELEREGPVAEQDRERLASPEPTVSAAREVMARVAVMRPPVEAWAFALVVV
jgi:hypothetical protein